MSDIGACLAEIRKLHQELDTRERDVQELELAKKHLEQELSELAQEDRRLRTKIRTKLLRCAEEECLLPLPCPRHPRSRANLETLAALRRAV